MADIKEYGTTLLRDWFRLDNAQVWVAIIIGGVGVAGLYTESGQFTLNSDGSGSKTSMYQTAINPACGGDCSDTLHRVE